MITYVNTVLVGTGVGTVLTAAPSANATKSNVTTHVGKYVVENIGGDTSKFHVGLVTGASYNKGKYYPTIKWSNDIKVADIKSLTFSEYTADTEDAVTIDFGTAASVSTNEAIRVVVRLTFKDLPTKYRKWTESYEVEVPKGTTAKGDIVDLFVTTINEKNDKRARVIATKSSNNLVLTAMPYDDDDSIDSISPAAKVRFSANAWLTKPNAAGFASKNKYSAATIVKTPGTYFTGSAKLVRDAEAQAMGYQGIINRGEGTWPIIKPAMNVDLNATYDVLTLEFENMYRAADDIFRKTKQTLQVFEKSDATKTIDAASGLLEAIQAMIDKENIKSEIYTKAEVDAGFTAA